MMRNKWYQAKVIHGKKIGKVLGYHTINLDNPEILKYQTEGVYAALVKIKNKIYDGVAFIGPRLTFGETVKVAEIFIFDFSGNIYDDVIQFKLIEYIRPVKKFLSTENLKKQLKIDCQKAKTILSRFSKL